MRTFPQTLQDNVIALHLPKDIKDEEIDNLIRTYLPKVFETQQGCVCAINGYYFDDRELYEIPEVTKLCQRLVERGFISMLHVSTLMDREEKPYLNKLFGAMEVWAIATGTLKPNGDLDMGQEEMDVFLAALDKSNKAANNVLFPKVADGQHRTRIS